MPSGGRGWKFKKRKAFWTPKTPFRVRIALKAIRIKSSHPDQYFQFQINPLHRPLRGYRFLVGPNCGRFAGVFRGPYSPYL